MSMWMCMSVHLSIHRNLNIPEGIPTPAHADALTGVLPGANSPTCLLLSAVVAMDAAAGAVLGSTWTGVMTMLASYGVES